MSPLTGILHVHSTYSYDGEHSLEEIAAFAGRRGYRFVGMAEHSDTLDDASVAAFVADCARVSSSNCLIIPGIEFTCRNKLHLLGFGVRSFTGSRDPLQVAGFIRRSGGIAVVAHPIRYGYSLPENLSGSVDGIEVWNAAYDGRFVPNDRSMRLVRSIRREHRSCLAFGGQDLHRLQDHRSVEITVDCDRLESAAVLDAIRRGDFIISNPYFTLASRRPIPWLRLAWFGLARRSYLLAKAARDFATGGSHAHRAG